MMWTVLRVLSHGALVFFCVVVPKNTKIEAIKAFFSAWYFKKPQKLKQLKHLKEVGEFPPIIILVF